MNNMAIDIVFEENFVDLEEEKREIDREWKKTSASCMLKVGKPAPQEGILETLKYYFSPTMWKYRITSWYYNR